MTRKCRKLGIDDGLVDIVKYTECLARDSQDWIRDPENHPFDHLDIHGMWIMIAAQTLRWYLEMEEEGILASLDAIIALCLICFAGQVCRAKVVAPGLATTLVPRLIRCLSQSGGYAMNRLRDADLDVWVGVTAVMTPSFRPEYEEQMWSVYLQAVARQSPRVETFMDLKKHLDKHSVWWPEILDGLVQNIWDDSQEMLQGSSNVVVGDPATSLTGILRSLTPKPVPKPPWSNPYICGASLDKDFDRDYRSIYTT